MAQFRTAQRPSLARLASAPSRATSPQRASLNGALLWLQGAAGNRAVRDELAAIQRDDAPATSQFKDFAADWPGRVTDNLTEARKNVPSDGLIAESRLGSAYMYVLTVFNATPQSDPVWVKLRIFGRGVAGVYDLVRDRNTNGKNTSKDIADDLRSWRLQAVELGPSLKRGADGGPASLDKWNDGIVFPLGRAILQTGQDDDRAVSEASTALEIIHMWREATPRDDPNRLQLISLERGVYTSFQRLREQAPRGEKADVGKDLDNAIEESKVIGQQIASIKPPPPEASEPTPPPKKPFVNDTELMRPGD